MGSPAAPARQVTISPVPGSRLEQLLDQRDAAVAAVTEAEQRRDAINDAIKAEAATMAAAMNGGRPPATINIPGSPHRTPLRMTWSMPWQFDTKRLKREQPLVYVQYAIRQQGRWTLTRATGGGL